MNVSSKKRALRRHGSTPMLDRDMFVPENADVIEELARIMHAPEPVDFGDTLNLHIQMMPDCDLR